MIDVTQHAITGVVPPAMGEVRIREVWPSVAASPGIARLGRLLTNTIFLAPLAWMIMGLVYFAKVMPITARRYVLSNLRVTLRRGWSSKVGGEAPLDRIRDIEVKNDENTGFFRASTLNILGDNGEAILVLPAVPEAENFKRAIMSARDAWFPRAVV